MIKMDNPFIMKLVQEFEKIIKENPPRKAAEILTMIMLESVRQCDEFESEYDGNPAGYLH